MPERMPAYLLHNTDSFRNGLDVLLHCGIRPERLLPLLLDRGEDVVLGLAIGTLCTPVHKDFSNVRLQWNSFATGEEDAGFARDGGKVLRRSLQSFEEDDDMLTSMGRELVTKHGIGESADALWKQLQEQQLRSPKQVAAPEPEVDTAGAPPVTIPTFASTLKFGVRPHAVPTQRQPVPSPAPEEFSLS